MNSLVDSKSLKRGVSIIFLLFLLCVGSAFGGSAMWKPDPTDGNWNSDGNWIPASAPNGPADTATFGGSVARSLFLSLNTEVNAIVFDPGAGAYTITVSTSFPQITLTLSGVGIANNSGAVQNFIAEGAFQSTQPGIIRFTNNATAGNLSSFTNQGGPGSDSPGGQTVFSDNANAGSGNFTNNTSAFGLGGSVAFHDHSSARDGTFTNNSGPIGGVGAGFITFDGASDAGNGTFTNNGGGFGAGFTGFSGSATAASATIINDGGTGANTYGGFTYFQGQSKAGASILVANSGSGGGGGGHVAFFGDSTGDTARVEVFGNGYLDVSANNAASVAVGSIEGTGSIFLGGKNLTAGSNDLTTTFSGVIQDGGPGGVVATGGSFTKTGTGTLTLFGANTYTGATILNAGKLLINGSITSAVAVNNGGTLGGSGTTGAVTVNSGGILSPGNSPGILRTNGNLSLAMGSTYLVELNGPTAGVEYDQTAVTGLVSLGNSTLSLSLGFAPASGSMFTIINNDLSDQITGTFNGLAEGAQFNASGETFQISYHGGDGNDAVLTALQAVPEPSTWAMMGIGGMLFFAFQRYRRSYSR